MIGFARFETSTAAGRVLGGILSFICGCAVALVLYAANVIPNEAGEGPTATSGEDLAAMFFGLVLFSPIIETLLLSLVFKFFSLKISAGYAAPLAGATVAAAHSFVHLAWGVVVFVPFLIYASPFVDLNVPFLKRMISSSLIHAFNNLLVFLVLLWAT